MSRTGVLIALIILAFSFGHAEASTVVTVGDLSFTEGDAGPHFVDVLLSSPEGVGLASYNFKFQILPTSGTSVLRFAAAQPDPSVMPGYVFEGNVSGLFFGSVVESSPELRDIYSGGDYSGDFFDMGLPTTAPGALLARLEVEHVGAVAPNAEHTFQISVLTGPGNTQFFDASYTEYTDIEVLGGSVTVLGTQASNPVPEPTAAVAWLGLGTMGMLGFRLRRRRRP